jgi:hypothetical protein
MNARRHAPPPEPFYAEKCAGTGVAIPLGMRLLLALVLLAATACVHNRPPETQNVPEENFNEENYSDVSTHGPGSESSEGYYGVGNSSSEPERTPASPEVGGQRRD